MRALFLLNDLTPGGVARVTVSLLNQLAPALRATGGAADLLLAGPEKALASLLPDSVQVRSIFDEPVRLRQSVFRAHREIREQAKNYDLLIPVSPQMTALTLGSGKPQVPWVHFQYKGMMDKKPEGLVTNALIRACYPWRKTMVFAGPGALRDMPASHDRNEWRFIPNPFEPAAYPEPGNSFEYVKALQADGLPIFGFVGRLSLEKGVDRILAAHRFLLKNGLDHHLVVIGDGPERRLLEQAGPRLHLLGADPNPLPAMSLFSATLLTSYMESWGMVAIESLSVGTPVVAYDCPSGPRSILTGDLAPGLVKNGDLNEFKRAVEWALTEAPAALVTKPQVVTDSAPDVVVRQWLDLFSEVLSS